MTHRSENQSYEDTLYDAVQNMHQQMPRGNQPSGRAWSQFAREAGISTLEQNESTSVTTPFAERVKVKEVTPHEQLASPRTSTNHLGPVTWFAAAMAVVLIVTSMSFWQFDDRNDPNEHSIALAPGTPDTSALRAIAEASPGPFIHDPIYGPEFACSAQPISEEAVYQSVVNPHQFSYHSSLSTPQAPKYGWEMDGNYAGTRDAFARAQDSFVPLEDPEQREALANVANDFWNCLMTGNAFQVWSFMDPITIQYEVLRYLPVERDEEMIRQFIREWGPRRYSAGITMVFPDLGNWVPHDASKHADEEWTGIRGDYLSEGNLWRADIRMIPHPEGEATWVVHLALTRSPEGGWWVTTFYGEE